MRLAKKVESYLKSGVGRLLRGSDAPPLHADPHYQNPRLFWEAWGDYFDQSPTQNKIYPQHAWLLAKVQEERPTSILEVGCGFGRNIRFLAEHLEYSPKFTGVDISEKLIAKAREYLKDVSRVSLHTAAIHDLGPAFNADMVVIHGVCMHIPPQEIAANVRSIASLATQSIVQCEEIRQDNGRVLGDPINEFTFSHDYLTLYKAQPALTVAEYFIGPHSLACLHVKKTNRETSQIR